MTGVDWTVRRVKHGSDSWRETVSLRQRILRSPLGLEFDEETLAAETADWHLAGMLHDQLVATLVLTRLDSHRFRMRQVAVTEDRQRQGIGRRLVQSAETFVQQAGGAHIVLHARVPVIGFYKKLGYKVTGERFEEIGIPHRRMEKSVRPD